MNWKTVKLEEVLKHRKGFITIDDKQEYKLCRVQLHRRGVLLRNNVFGKDIKTKKQQVCKAGDFLVAEMDAKFGGYGFIPKELDKAIVSSHYFLFELDEEKIRQGYLEVISQLLILQDQIKAVGSTNYSAIRPRNVLNWEIPIPSIQEQIKIEKLFDDSKSNGDQLRNELNLQLDLIKQLRQSFLREAMKGKLITHSNPIETGHQLLAKIKAEKAQLIKSKKLKAGLVSSQSISFIKKNNIPKTWTWCKADEIFFITKLAGFEYSKHIKLEISGEIPVVRAQNVRPLKINKNNLLYIDKETSLLLDRCALTKECLLVTFIGAGIGDVSTFNESNRWHLAPNVAKMEPFLGCENSLNVKFINYFMMSGIGQKEIFKHVKATAQPSLSMGTIRDIDIPLPPIHEQDQIVEKLEELMKFCDGLEQSINESQEYNDMLLQQVLREALQPNKKTKTLSVENRKIENPLKTILAGHIINLNNTTDFGRVKFQKLLFLIEYICKIDFDSNYIKKVAGPYDDILIKSIESDFNRMRFFNVVQDKKDNKRVRYTALAGAKELESLFLENFADESLRINNTLLKFRPLNWGECELIATLYAVWNNRIIKKELITDELLYSDFMAWDKQKSKYHSVFHKWLFWMKDERIIPDGWGKYIDMPQ